MGREPGGREPLAAARYELPKKVADRGGGVTSLNSANRREPSLRQPPCSTPG